MRLALNEAEQQPAGHTQTQLLTSVGLATPTLGTNELAQVISNANDLRALIADSHNWPLTSYVPLHRLIKRSAQLLPYSEHISAMHKALSTAKSNNVDFYSLITSIAKKISTLLPEDKLNIFNSFVEHAKKEPPTYTVVPYGALIDAIRHLPAEAQEEAIANILPALESKDWQPRHVASSLQTLASVLSSRAGWEPNSILAPFQVALPLCQSGKLTETEAHHLLDPFARNAHKLPQAEKKDMYCEIRKLAHTFSGYGHRHLMGAFNSALATQMSQDPDVQRQFSTLKNAAYALIDRGMLGFISAAERGYEAMTAQRNR